ncbi:hypothetical protein DTL42_22320 [Bremerella cremea]|uniref:Zinc finger/thioredoxin putative domain-containing protein n=1 Tax=Bremerella cremea TaxID=1031537 RepID=A0A368KMS7_9BACT|nr:MJ0042-type zinc finger domain-containing protein [Bremerella cremea]RCS41305.1 hypothetical protein DTL42_22320 [Bremerella cremea]
MPKLFVVCPNCKGKYSVANEDIAGKSVKCQKCSQKFTAKVYAASSPKPTAARSAPSPVGFSDSDLFGDSPEKEDIFADLASPSSPAPTLGSLPPMTRKKAASRSIPIAPIVIGVGGIALVAVIVMVGISIANSAGDWGGSSIPPLPSNGSPAGNSFASSAPGDDQANFEQHHEVLDTQMKLMNRFIDAMEGVNGEQDLPQFVSTVNGLSSELRSLATQVANLPKISSENNKKLSQEAERRTKEFLPRMKAAGQRMAQYNRNAEVTNAMLDFQAAGKEVSNAISSARTRLANSPAPKRQSPTPTRRRSNKPLTNFQSRYGFENTVTFRGQELEVKHGQMITEHLKPMLADTASAASSSSNTGGVVELHYEGEISDLVPHVTFGEIKSVDENERTIYLNSVNFP